MMVANYSSTAKFFHWTIALFVLGTVPLGLVLDSVPKGPIQDNLYDLHKSLGVLIFALITLRIIYRFAHGAPPPDVSLKRWEIAASETVHWALYTALLVMPILGYVANSAYGATTPFFGLFEISPLIAKNEPLSEWLFEIHGWLGWAVGVMFCMHIAAALQHYFIKRDGVLQRMLPRSLGGN